MLSTDSLTAYDAMTDQLLLESTRKGDLDAYATLWRRHEAVTRRIAASISRDLSAEDLVAKAYTRTLETIQRGSGPQEHFRAYLLTVIRRTAADWSKHSSRTTLVGGSDELATIMEIAGDTSAQTGSESGILLDAFQRLPERTRLLLWYSIVENYKPREMAPIFGMTVGAVTVAAHRARAALRTSWLQTFADARQPATPECAEAIEQMGDFVSHRRFTKRNERIGDHIARCPSCTETLTSVQNVEVSLRGVLVPAAAAVGLVAQSTGSTTGFSLAHGALLSKPAVIAATTLTVVATTTAVLTGAFRSDDVPDPDPSATSMVSPADPSPTTEPAQESGTASNQTTLEPSPTPEDQTTPASLPPTADVPTPSASADTTAALPAVDMPRLDLTDGAVFTTRTPTISGTARPGAAVTAVVSGGTIGYTVLSATADSTGSWSSVTPELDDAAFVIRAYQTLPSGERSGAAEARFTVDDTTPAPLPVITAVDTDGGRLAPALTGTGTPGAQVVVYLNDVPSTSVVQADGSWSVLTGAGAVVGQNTVTATQTLRGGSVASPRTDAQQVTLVAPSATTEHEADGTLVATVRSLPGSSLAVLISGRTVHHVAASRGVDVIRLTPTGGSSGPGGPLTVQVRYATADGTRVGPYVDAG